MSDEIDDGSEPAFPTPGKAFEFTGLTIRDWFAGQALTGLAYEMPIKDSAKTAYAIADAMIKERNK